MPVHTDSVLSDPPQQSVKLFIATQTKDVCGDKHCFVPAIEIRKISILFARPDLIFANLSCTRSYSCFIVFFLINPLFPINFRVANLKFAILQYVEIIKQK